MGRAEDHAQGVDEICLAIAGAVIWKGNDISVMEREGHSHGAIQACFSNVSTTSEVKRFFRDL